MKKLLPLILLLVGLGAGVGAGIFLRPASHVDDHAMLGEGMPVELEHAEDKTDGQNH